MVLHLLPVFLGPALGKGLIIGGDTFVLVISADVFSSLVITVLSLDDKELESQLSDSVISLQDLLTT
jgi:hypothetical protein